MRRLLISLSVVAALAAGKAPSQEFSALARVIPGASTITDNGNFVELNLTLSQAVPYRVFSLDNPRRIVLDFNEVDFAAMPADSFDASVPVTGFRYGAISAGWSRLVLDIDRPLAVQTAALSTSATGRAVVLVRLEPMEEAAFSAAAGTPEAARLTAPDDGASSVRARQRQTGDRPVIVVLDPGHGGIDPGAERADAVEADLMLTFALELKEVLLRAGNFDVVLTRDGDQFVPLEARVSIARRANADLFISLHADALAQGRASGLTVYTLSERASDLASAKLAERHDRADLLAGVDLSYQDDEVAAVLMDLARTETAPRSDRLADALVVGLSNTVGMHRRPRLSAGFSVLKAPDIPSVLLELGFLSSARDLGRLQDSEWRGLAATGIRDALKAWVVTDAADALLLRK